MIGTLILNMLCLASSAFSKNEDLASTSKKDWTFKVNNTNAGKCPAGVYLLKVNNKSLTQVFSCEYYEIFSNSFFYRTPPVAASIDNPLTHFMLLIFFYNLLKTLKNLWFSHVFRGYRKTIVS